MIAALLFASATCATSPQQAARTFTFPPFTGYVVDRAEVIGSPERRRLAERLGRVERRTGHQVAVVTVNSLGGHSIESYATALGNDWGIGRRGRNDGVLLLIAPHERRVRIAVGCGLERKLTDSKAATIISDGILPAFRAGHMELGIASGVDGILREIAPGEEGK